jgi:hypothetical protein
MHRFLRSFRIRGCAVPPRFSEATTALAFSLGNTQSLFA